MFLLLLFTLVPACGYCAMYSTTDELITTDTKDGAVWERMIGVNILVGAAANRR